MLIQNYGHLWERKYINWGRGRVKGHLQGYNGNKKADFREQIGIYVLFDKDLVPIYIGQVGAGQRQLFNRLNEHTTDHLWNRWEHFGWFGLRRVNKDGKLSGHDKSSKTFKSSGVSLLNEIEAALITALEPKLNKQGPRWKDAVEFYQYVDEEMDDVTMSAIMERHDHLEQEIAKLAKVLRKKKGS